MGHFDSGKPNDLTQLNGIKHSESRRGKFSQVFESIPWDAKDHDRDTPGSDVLLVRYALIDRDQNVEIAGFSSSE